MGRILIIDDDPQLLKSFEKLLKDEGHDILAASSGEAGLKTVRDTALDLVIADVRLPGMNGLDAFRAINDIESKLPVIIMTAYGTTETAIEATKLGAYDFILKPFDIPEMLSTVDKALEAGRFMRTRVELDLPPDPARSDAIIGRSKSMQEVYKAIGRVAGTDATVLIRGESGTGKELIARAVYQHSTRAHRAFLIINCVAIPDTLLESELFGYEKGAFTGAVHRRIGKIEQADGGTLFLDEIGDMPFNIQSKILRLLQEKSIERLGGRDPISVDVRIVAATNRDLEAALDKGKFREDLYYRLKVVTINLPPLRERKEDILPLADYFLTKYAGEMNIENPGLTPEAKESLQQYAWPGNVRELSNTIQKALIFNRGRPIAPEDTVQAMHDTSTPENLKRGDEQSVVRQWIRDSVATQGGPHLFNQWMDRFAGIVITEALRLTGGNRTRAAEILGLSRPTLIAKIEKYGIRIEASVKNE